MTNYMENFKKQVKEEFQDYYDQNWYEYEGEWDDFKEEAIETLWNNYSNEPIVKDYEALMLMLDTIKTYYEDYGIDFKDYNDPQKVFNLGMYFIAKEVLGDSTQEDYHKVILEAQS